MFDGEKWNAIFNIQDLGAEPNTNAYNVLSGIERNARADKLFEIAEKMCLLIL